MKKRIFAAVLCGMMLLLCACEGRGAGSPGSEISPKTIEEYRAISEAMRNAIPKENVLMADDSDTVFGSEYDRGEITAVIFSKELKRAPKDSWDVSRDGNGKVVAWVESGSDGLELHIAGQGGIRAPESCRNLFRGYTDVRTFDFGGCFDTSAVEDMGGMFRDCACVEGTLDLTTFQTAEVTDMAEMFSGMEQVEALDLAIFDTANVTDMRGMFRDCGAETLDLSGFDTAEVTDMSEMFCGSRLRKLELESFNTASVTDMSGMFRDCVRLEKLNISSFRTPNVEDMSGMFEGCGLSSIDLSRFDTAEVTDMSNLFAGCENVIKLDLSALDTGNVVTMASMFRGCSGLVTVDVSSFDTSWVTDMSGMFYDCNMLDTPDLKHFDVSNVEEYDQFMSPGVEVDGEPWQAIFTSRHHLTFD